MELNPEENEFLDHIRAITSEVSTFDGELNRRLIETNEIAHEVYDQLK